MLKQKLMGLALVVLGIFSAVYTGDGTAALLVVPMGLGAIFTKEYILTLDETKKSARSCRNSYGRRCK